MRGSATTTCIYVCIAVYSREYSVAAFCAAFGIINNSAAAFASATARERESGVAALPTVSDRRDFFGTHGVATRFFLMRVEDADLEQDASCDAGVAFALKRTDGASGDAGGAGGAVDVIDRWFVERRRKGGMERFLIERRVHLASDSFILKKK
jgi:hypothetical protein